MVPLFEAGCPGSTDLSCEVADCNEPQSPFSCINTYHHLPVSYLQCSESLILWNWQLCKWYSVQ